MVIIATSHDAPKGRAKLPLLATIPPTVPPMTGEIVEWIVLIPRIQQFKCTTLRKKIKSGIKINSCVLENLCVVTYIISVQYDLKYNPVVLTFCFSVLVFDPHFQENQVQPCSFKVILSNRSLECSAQFCGLQTNL